MKEAIEKIGAHSPQGVFVCDSLSLKLLYANQHFAKLFDKSPDQLLREPAIPLSLLRTEEIKYLQQVHSELLTSGAVSDAEICLHLPEGRAKRVRCDIFKINEEEAVGFIRDLTPESNREDFLLQHTIVSGFLLDYLDHVFSETHNWVPALLPAIETLQKDKDPAATHRFLDQLRATLHSYSEKIKLMLRALNTITDEPAVTITRFDLLQFLPNVIQTVNQLYPDKKIDFSANQTSYHISTDSLKLFRALQLILFSLLRTGVHTLQLLADAEQDCLILDIRLPETTEPAAVSINTGTLAENPELAKARELLVQLKGQLQINTAGKGFLGRIQLPKF